MDGARPQDGGQAQVDGRVGQRIHERGYPAHPDLLPRQVLGRRAVSRFFRFLPAEGADHPHALQVFGGLQKQPVQLFLDGSVQFDGASHDEKHDHEQRADHAGEKEALVSLDPVRHQHGAEHDERGAQDEAEKHVDPVLDLVGVAGHPGDEGGLPDPVRFGAGKPHDMAEQVVAQRGSESGRGL